MEHLIGAAPPGPDGNPYGVKLHFGAPLPADANAEVQPAPGNDVHGGHHLGQQHGIVQRNDDNSGHDPDGPGGPGGGGHGRKVQHCGPRGIAVHQVLAHRYAVKTERFGPAGEFGHIPITLDAQAATKGQFWRSHEIAAPDTGVPQTKGVLIFTVDFHPVWITSRKRSRCYPWGKHRPG